jgi:hypothetical protein
MPTASCMQPADLELFMSVYPRAVRRQHLSYQTGNYISTLVVPTHHVILSFSRQEPRLPLSDMPVAPRTIATLLKAFKHPRCFLVSTTQAFAITQVRHLFTLRLRTLMRKTSPLISDSATGCCCFGRSALLLRFRLQKRKRFDAH